MVDRDRCLASQEIRELISKGIISHEGSVQPSSFEPILDEYCYVLDAEGGIFHPSRGRTVRRSLLELPGRQRREVDIRNGFEIKVGGNYLFPLKGKMESSDSIRFLKSSPKSSPGRVFLNDRFLSDYNDSFDEVSNFSKDGLNTWLLVQPLAFNLIVGPKISLNQLRFFKGYESQLSTREVIDWWRSHPLMHLKDENGGMGMPVDPTLGEALRVHLDLEGRGSYGIVGLRARKNPFPIDLREEGLVPSEDYFEPLKAKNGKLKVKPGEHYLISSQEVLNIHAELNSELKPHSHLGISGVLHRAGFIDNLFQGDLVFEVTSEEPTDRILSHGMPIGELCFYRTKLPQDIDGKPMGYGKEIGSHYQGQMGPKVAKYLKVFDFEAAAKNHKKLDREVLVQDAKLLLNLRKEKMGFELISLEEGEELINMIENDGFFHSRYDCEDDSLILQTIPYVIGFGPERKVFSYVRASDIQDYGDKRLFGKHSIGIGGHVSREDGPEFIKGGLERELEEEVNITGEIIGPKIVGTLYQPDSPVDQVHFGLVYGFYTTGNISQSENSIVSGRMISLSEIWKNKKMQEGYETWSKVLIPHLPNIYDAVLKKSF